MPVEHHTTFRPDASRTLYLFLCLHGNVFCLFVYGSGASQMGDHLVCIKNCTNNFKIHIGQDCTNLDADQMAPNGHQTKFGPLLINPLLQVYMLVMARLAAHVNNFKIHVDQDRTNLDADRMAPNGHQTEFGPMPISPPLQVYMLVVARLCNHYC